MRTQTMMASIPMAMVYLARLRLLKETDFNRITAQKYLALSCTEAEIFEMSDALTYSHWLTVLSKELPLSQHVPVTES